ncbi:MAG: ABC transporter permease subunit [Chloroflexi bacterium]|nr:ABC transporter permease subunit [Chloroflexota bacterium]
MTEATGRPHPGHARVPPWRDTRVRALALQVLVVGGVLLVLGALLANLLTEMGERRLTFDLGFLRTTAGFEIGEHVIEYSPRDSYGHALLVGALNTLLVAVLGVILATILGLIVGVARLSGNWLVNRVAFVYVELFRNTPLLVQLFILYFAVFLQLPPVRDSITLPGSVYLNQRGVFMPRPVTGESADAFLLALGVGAVIALVLWVVGSRRAAAGRPIPHATLLGLLALVGLPALAWLIAPTAPIVLEDPVVGRFNITGGLTFSSAFSALLLGLVLYTAAFIAEVVRGGIQAVSTGQREAARAIGLRDGQVLRLVVLPQALRVIVPPLTSQYLNLAKNSSLAIAIGYPDLFNVSTTVANQTGQPVAVIAFVMLIYLIMSLVTSLVMNLYNRTVRLRER